MNSVYNPSVRTPFQSYQIRGKYVYITIRLLNYNIYKSNHVAWNRLFMRTVKKRRQSNVNESKFVIIFVHEMRQQRN